MTAIIAGGGKEEKSGSKFSARGMPTISPTAHSHQAYQVSRVASSTGAQNAQKICAFSPNWVFFFCQNWIFSAEEFLRCHCSICQKSQNRDQFQFFFQKKFSRETYQGFMPQKICFEQPPNIKLQYPWQPCK